MLSDMCLGSPASLRRYCRRGSPARSALFNLKSRTPTTKARGVLDLGLWLRALVAQLERAVPSWVRVPLSAPSTLPDRCSERKRHGSFRVTMASLRPECSCGWDSRGQKKIDFTTVWQIRPSAPYYQPLASSPSTLREAGLSTSADCLADQI